VSIASIYARIFVLSAYGKHYAHFMKLIYKMWNAAAFFPDKSEVQCLHRWKKVLNPELIKGHWTKEVET